MTAAEQQAQQELVIQVKAADAEKQAAELHAETVVIKAEAEKTAAEKETDAKKMLAEATRAEVAATGLAEAEVTVAKADALKREGTSEAEVLELKFAADAKGITQKAEAMKLFDGVGREHEEFKLKLNKEKEIELEAISTQQAIAEAQAEMVGEALKSANIDIVGGDNKFFESIVGSVTAGKQVDRLVDNSTVLGDVKETFFNSDPEHFQSEMQRYVKMFGISTDDMKNLSVAALLGQMMGLTNDSNVLGQLQGMISMASRAGVANAKAATLKLTGKTVTS